MKRCIVKVDLAANGKVGVSNKYGNDSFVTSINGTKEETAKYYAIGKVFNMGIWYDSMNNEHEDNLMHVTNVFILENCEKTSDFVGYLSEKYGWDWQKYFCKEEYEKFCA